MAALSASRSRFGWINKAVLDLHQKKRIVIESSRIYDPSDPTTTKVILKDDKVLIVRTVVLDNEEELLRIVPCSKTIYEVDLKEVEKAAQVIMHRPKHSLPGDETDVLIIEYERNGNKETLVYRRNDTSYVSSAGPSPQLIFAAAEQRAKEMREEIVAQMRSSEKAIELRKKELLDVLEQIKQEDGKYFSQISAKKAELKALQDKSSKEFYKLDKTKVNLLKTEQDYKGTVDNLNRVRGELSDFEDKLATTISDSEAESVKLNSLKSQVDRATDELANAKAFLTELNKEIAESTTTYKETRSALDSAKTELNSLLTEKTKIEKDISTAKSKAEKETSAKQDFDLLQNETEQQVQKLDLATDKRVQAEKQLKELDDQIKTASLEVKRQTASLGSVQKKLSDEQARLQQAKFNIERFEENISRLKTEQQELVETNANLAKDRNVLDGNDDSEFHDASETLEPQSGELEGQIAKLQETSDVQNSQLVDLTQRIEVATNDEKKKVEEVTSGLQKKVDAFTEDTVQLQETIARQETDPESQLTEVSAELNESRQEIATRQELLTKLQQEAASLPEVQKPSTTGDAIAVEESLSQTLALAQKRSDINVKIAEAEGNELLAKYKKEIYEDLQQQLQTRLTTESNDSKQKVTECQQRAEDLKQSTITYGTQLMDDANQRVREAELTLKAAEQAPGISSDSKTAVEEASMALANAEADRVKCSNEVAEIRKVAAEKAAGLLDYCKRHLSAMATSALTGLRSHSVPE